MSCIGLCWCDNQFMNIRVLLEYDEETQGYSATCPELNFVSSCGDTKEEALESLKEAIKLLLTPIPEHLLETNGPVEEIRLAL